MLLCAYPCAGTAQSSPTSPDPAQLLPGDHREPILAAAQRDLDQAHALMAAVHWQEAEQKFQAALDQEPDDGDALAELGWLQMQHHQPKAAADSFVRLTELEPHRGRGHFLLGLLFAGHQLFPRAEMEFKLADQREPENSDILYNLALAQVREQHTGDAEATLSRALAAHPDNVAALRLRANLEASRGALQQAGSDFFQIARLQPSDESAWLDLGRLDSTAADYAEAVEALNHAVTLEAPPAAHARLVLAAVQHRWGRDAEALATLAPLLQTNPVPDALLLSGLCHEQMQNFPAAVAAYKRLIQTAPQDYRGYQLLGSRQLEANQVSGAITHLSTAVRLAPGFEPAHTELAKAWLRQKNWAQAEAETRAAIRLRPDDARPHYLLARILEHQGDRQGAQAQMALVQKLDTSARQAAYPHH